MFLEKTSIDTTNLFQTFFFFTYDVSRTKKLGKLNCLNHKFIFYDQTPRQTR